MLKPPSNNTYLGVDALKLCKYPILMVSLLGKLVCYNYKTKDTFRREIETQDKGSGVPRTRDFCVRHREVHFLFIFFKKFIFCL